MNDHKMRSKQEKRWADLMRQAQKGNQAAYKTLLLEINRVLRSFILKRVNTPEVSEDIVQEILMAIHKVRHTYDPKRRFTPWMFAIARYKFIDYVRARARNQERSFENEQDISKHVVQNPEQDFENTKMLEDALSDLPEKQRIAITLLKLKGYSVKEVSSKTGMSPSDVKVSSHRAIKRLRKFFKVGEDENK